MIDDVRNYVMSCNLCLKTWKPSRHNASSSPIQSTYFGELLVMDLKGPISPTPHNEKYILALQDHFSKWVDVYLLQSTSTEETIRVLRHHFSRSDTEIPKQILTDRGTNFTSHEFLTFCKQLGIKKLTTTSRNPQANGSIERFNREIANRLRKLPTEQHHTWPIVVKNLVNDHNRRIHRSHRFSPFQIRFSRSPRTSINEPTTIDNIKMLKVARKNIEAYRQSMRSNTRPPRFQFVPGNKVWYYSKQPDHFGKSIFIKSGPHTVIRKINPHSMLISDIQYPVSVHRLKPVVERLPYLIPVNTDLQQTYSTPSRSQTRREEQQDDDNILPLTNPPNVISHPFQSSSQSNCAQIEVSELPSTRVTDRTLTSPLSRSNNSNVPIPPLTTSMSTTSPPLISTSNSQQNSTRTRSRKHVTTKYRQQQVRSESDGTYKKGDTVRIKTFRGSQDRRKVKTLEVTLRTYFPSTSKWSASLRSGSTTFIKKDCIVSLVNRN